MFRIKFTIAVLIALTCLQSKGQRVGSIIFSDSEGIVKCFNRLEIKDSLLIVDAFKKCLSRVHEDAFLEARIDSIIQSSEGHVAYGYKGKRYSIGEIEVDSLSEIVFLKSGIKPKKLQGKGLGTSQFNKQSRRAITFYENRGFPFAYTEISDVSFQDERLNAKYRIELGPVILFDTLYVKGDARIHRKFLEAHLNYSKGKPYSQALAQNFDKEFNRLGFVSVIKPTEVEFIPGKARIHAYLTNKPMSHFTGIIGFFSKEENGKIGLAGDVNLRLTNTFKRGETNVLRWQAMANDMQKLAVQTVWPFILGRNLSASGSFDMLRRDTSFITINPKVEITFQLPNSHVGIGLNYKSSYSTAIQSAQISTLSTLLYSLSFGIGQATHEAFPISNNFANFTLAVGNREVLGGSIYAQQAEKTVVGEALAYVESYLPIYGEQFVFNSRVQMALFQPMNRSVNIQENEAYLLGGAGTLRGFNDGSILARHYAIVSLEPQYRLAQNLNLFLFVEGGLVSYTSLGAWHEEYPYSTGAGCEIVSKGGIFSLSYALGKGFGERMEIKNSKIHIGYQALF